MTSVARVAPAAPPTKNVLQFQINDCLIAALDIHVFSRTHQTIQTQATNPSINHIKQLNKIHNQSITTNPINQSIKQSTNQSINQSINQIKHSINKSTNQLIN